MSWTSRLGNLGRFSPFTRSPPQGSNKVSDADFSYITDEDLHNHQQQSAQDDGPPRDTDVLILKNKKNQHAVHFPAYSIAKGELTVGQVREYAARKTGADVRRIKLLYKGKNLKDDSRTAKQEGLRDGAELMCTTADSSDSDDEDDDDEFGDLSGGDNNAEESGRRKRNRGKKSKRRNKREQQNSSGTSTPQQTEFFNLNIPPPAQTSSAPSPSKIPTTPMEKLDALRATLSGFIPDVQKFLKDPPNDAAKREFEHKRLSETILTQVLLKLDAVETEGDVEARGRRKELVRETQEVLQKVDGGK